ncbi:MAG TPA: ArdC family protein [Thermoguttaceae bacterium]|nr:ArdC family protein [Thermoguttaceae bacterium]
MQFYRKAESAANTILRAFQTGNLPQALAPIFIRRRDNVPCRAWSWSNQLLTALAGHSDARGYRQWQEVGRHVKKGERSFAILVPIVRKRTEKNGETGDEEERTWIAGFTSAAVFGLNQTEGEPLPPPDPEVTRWLENLPLLDVAREWGLSVDAYNGRPGAALGKYRRGNGIALGVENLSTWAHEMCHAADDRLGNLQERGQHWRSETVAELGGAILLEVLGYDHDADRGGCFQYVQAYATDAGIEPVTACQRVLKRTCDAVVLILDTAEGLREAKPEAMETAVAAVA